MSQIPEKYQPLLKVLRQTLRDCGGEPLSEPEAYGINEFYKSQTCGIELVMDYGSLHDVRTPDGSLTPYGSCRSASNPIKFLELLTKRLGLEMIQPQRDDTKVSEMAYQTSPSGPVFSVKFPVIFDPFEL